MEILCSLKRRASFLLIFMVGSCSSFSHLFTLAKETPRIVASSDWVTNILLRNNLIATEYFMSPSCFQPNRIITLLYNNYYSFVNKMTVYLHLYMVNKSSNVIVSPILLYELFFLLKRFSINCFLSFLSP